MRTFPGLLIALAAGLLLGGQLAAQQFEKVPEAKPATPASTPAGVNIGVFNFQAAMASTQEGKKAAEELQAQFNPRRAELEKLQNEIRDLENQLRAQERTLSEEARLQLLRQIEQKRRLGTRLDQNLRDDIEEAQTEHINRIGQKMQRVIDQYARQKSLSVILNIYQGGPILYAIQGVDITDDIIRLYDQTYPVPAAAGASQPPPARPSPPPRSNPPPPRN